MKSTFTLPASTKNTTNDNITGLDLIGACITGLDLIGACITGLDLIGAWSRQFTLQLEYMLLARAFSKTSTIKHFYEKLSYQYKLQHPLASQGARKPNAPFEWSRNGSATQVRRGIRITFCRLYGYGHLPYFRKNRSKRLHFGSKRELPNYCRHFVPDWSRKWGLNRTYAGYAVCKHFQKSPAPRFVILRKRLPLTNGCSPITWIEIQLFIHWEIPYSWVWRLNEDWL